MGAEAGESLDEMALSREIMVLECRVTALEEALHGIKEKAEAALGAYKVGEGSSSTGE